MVTTTTQLVLVEQVESDSTSKPDRSRLGRRSRRKGKVWERELAALLRPIFPNAKRGFQNRSGRDGCDVEGTTFWVEAKHGKCVNVRGALKQALDDTDGRPAVVVAKDDRSAPFVVMTLNDWLALAKRLNAVTISNNQTRQSDPSLVNMETTQWTSSHSALSRTRRTPALAGKRCTSRTCVPATCRSRFGAKAARSTRQQ